MNAHDGTLNQNIDDRHLARAETPSLSLSGGAHRRTLPAAIRQFLKNVADAIVKARERHRTRTELEHLDERLLRDIGLTRFDLDRPDLVARTSMKGRRFHPISAGAAPLPPSERPAKYRTAGASSASPATKKIDPEVEPDVDRAA